MSIIQTALSQYGVKEVEGKNHNKEILEYFHEIGHDWVKTDETAWCSAFVNWVCKKAGKPYTGKLNARSWLNVGESTDTPKQGDIVVLWRESRNSWKGHVGFFVKQTKRYVYILGGNQGNRVCIQAYTKSRILDYRTFKN